MSRSVSLALLAALVLAPAAAAQMNNDRMMDDGRMMEDQRMMEDDMMSSASASAMDGEMMSATASASSLPSTGGTPLVPLLSVLALALIGVSGMVAARIVRHNS